MTERQPPGERRAVTPKDVFDRSNMPSRWERITNVAPKISEDRRCLAFVAARYLGEKRLPHPNTLAVPDEFRQRERAALIGGWAAATAFSVMVICAATELSVLAGVAAVVLAGTVVATASVWLATGPAIHEYESRKLHYENAEARLRANPMHASYRSILDKMITCDEGTLAYCAAKIVSEIRRNPAWKSEHLAVARIDLLHELSEIAQSARQIADDRHTTEQLERNRLRDDPEVREMIEADKQLRREALGLLAARVHALADYRDRVLRRGLTAVRERDAANRALRLAADELAIDRLQ